MTFQSNVLVKRLGFGWVLLSVPPHILLFDGIDS